MASGCGETPCFFAGGLKLPFISCKIGRSFKNVDLVQDHLGAGDENSDIDFYYW
jgi:hypothetical protein